MKWSWKLGRFAGIDVRVHATFLLLVAWVAWIGYGNGGGATGAVAEVIFILLVFLSVVLHEYGHALTARRFGVGTREITLLPIGGVAQLERMPREPRQELLIALAGPAVTVALAVILWVVMAVLHMPANVSALVEENAPLLSRLMWVNVWLFLFNVLPAFPMDGGRVLRAALAMRMGYGRATGVAAEVGKGFALLFGIVGLFSSPFLVLIALFVWLGAAGEAASVQTQSAFAGVPVERVMIRDIQTLAPTDPLSRAVDAVLGGFQQDFPVVDANGVVGMLTRQEMVKGLSAHGADSPVAESMQREFETTSPSESLDTAFARLQACRCRTMPVVDRGRLVGVLTAENVGEYVMIQGAGRGVGARG